MTYFPAVVREWRRKPELGQYAREGEGVVVVSVLLMAGDPSVLLQKAPRQKGSVEPRSGDRSPLCVAGQAELSHLLLLLLSERLRTFFKSLFCFCKRVLHFLEHEEVSNWKNTIPLRESNFFMTPGYLYQILSSKADLGEHGSWTAHPLTACQL